ncbi:TPA: TdeIII family type II restriction endonuclease [Legionella anisa]
MNRHEIKEIVKNTIVKSIEDFAKKSLKKKPKFQILDLIIPKERKIRSIVGGLETSLGTTLWEPLAKALASINGFEVYNENLLCPTNMPSALNNILQSIVDDRKKYGGIYNAQSSHDEIRRVCQTFLSRPIDSFENAPKGRGVDIWLYKDGVNYFFDTKTVQPNLSALTSYLEQILYWYAYYYCKKPGGLAVARIVFPYNPNREKPFWNSVIGKGKPLEPDTEAWVENQFWDFCSGCTGTYEIIINSFEEIRESMILEHVLNNLLK